ncbi:MAG: LysR family transcriptional regulator [Verrucomicrobiota bacterium]
MNIHHLELFYYVAKHQGVSAAARHIPYGIQQPAISAQIIQLEDSVGVTLFQRRPFELTEHGRELFAFIEPFFSGLPKMADRLRGGNEVRLRVGAPPAIQYCYLPRLLKALKQRFAHLEFSLFTGWQGEFEARLLAGELDLVVTSMFGKPSAGMRHRDLLSLPMALLVREKSRIKSADDFWKQDRIEEPLICVEEGDALCRTFQHELQRRKIEWYPALELAALDLVAEYVAQGFGVGLVVDQPDTKAPPGTRRLRLDDFPPLTYVAMWQGKPTPLIETFLEGASHMADELGRLHSGLPS